MWTSLGTSASTHHLNGEDVCCAVSEDFAESPDASPCELKRTDPGEREPQAGLHRSLHTPRGAEQLPGLLYLNFRPSNHILKAPEVVIAAA